MSPRTDLKPPGEPTDTATPATVTGFGRRRTEGVRAFFRGRRRVLGGVGLVTGFLTAWVVVCALLDAGIVGGLLAGVLLYAALQVLVRRRPVRDLWARDTVGLASRWPGKVLVGAALLTIPVALLFESFRVNRYTDNSWTAVMMALALALAYLLTRRLLVTVVSAAVVVTATGWGLAPHLATARHRDAFALHRLDAARRRGMLDGFHDVAIAQIDTRAATPRHFGGFGVDASTPMEVGSITKAMTGLVVADAVARGDVRMDVPVSTYLPQLAGTRAGTVTLRELSTHTAGYVDFGAATMRRAAWSAPFGRSFVTDDLAHMITAIRVQTLSGRGTWRYSSLGAATAGQGVAAAAGLSYADLVRTRLFTPLGMHDTYIEDDHDRVAGGATETGLPAQPWVLDGYAPAGGAVSSTGDLAKLAAALLDGTAPGMAALDPTTPDGARVGGFWVTSAWDTGQTITWHTGQTSGYTSYLGIDRAHHKAVVVLSDVATSATAALGAELLAGRR